MTFDQLKSSLLNIKVYNNQGNLAPHKPLLLLLALTDFYMENKTSWSYIEIEERLKNLIEQFGPGREVYHPEYPFLRLRKDNLWVIQANDILREDSAADLRKYNAVGAFPNHVLDVLQSNLQRVPELIYFILDNKFPETIHTELLDQLGFHESKVYSTLRKVRDPLFREKILISYGYKCAVCGLSARLGDSLIGIEAAHIKWHQAGGPDITQNGMALCSMHHKLFDRGAFGLNRDHHIIASAKIHDGPQLDEILFRFQGKKIQLPLNPTEAPKELFLNWHWRNIFRKPVKYFQDLEKLDIAADN